MGLAALKLEPAREAQITEELTQQFEDRFQELVTGGATEGQAQRDALEELRNGDLLAKGLRQVLARVADHPINRIEELLPWRLVADAAKESAHPW